MILKDSSYSNGTLALVLDLSSLRSEVLKELKTLEGRIKDTEFNRIDVHSLDVKFLNGGAVVKGRWRVNHRERIFYNFFAGHWAHSPWICVAGYFEQYFELSIVKGVLKVQPTKNRISTGNWYAFFVDLLVSWTNANGALRNAIKNGLRNVNGANLTNTLMGFKAEIAKKTGLTIKQVEHIVKSTNTLNATLMSNSINVSIVVPKHVIV
jgi:hypothetical protein